MTNNHITWWDTACLELSEKDPVMKKLIGTFNQSKLSSFENPFYSLSKSIVGQQISVQAADSIWLRIRNNYNVCSESCFLEASIKNLRKLGLSERKASYLIKLSERMKHDNNFSKWKKMSDEDIKEKLILFKGIGPWSIKMFLIFCLNRPDIFSKDDIGLLKAIGKNYYNGIRPSMEKAEKLSLSWKPWRTLASWYLWRSIDPNVVSY